MLDPIYSNEDNDADGNTVSEAWAQMAHRKCDHLRLQRTAPAPAGPVAKVMGWMVSTAVLPFVHGMVAGVALFTWCVV
jgi:hypothetical protein